MSVCLLIMCIALCVTLSASSGSFPMFFPKTISPLCTSLPHVFGQQRQRQSNAMLFGETLQGVAKNVSLVCCLQCVPLAQKLGNEAGRSQGGEKTHAAINQQTDFFANGHHYIFANIITDDE